MPALSARQIGTAALLMIGVASAEQPISAFMAEHALGALNSMLDSWSTEKLLVFTRPKIPLVLVPGRATYTWGISAPPADIPREPPVQAGTGAAARWMTPCRGWSGKCRSSTNTQYQAGIQHQAADQHVPLIRVPRCARSP